MWLKAHYLLSVLNLATVGCGQGLGIRGAMGKYALVVAALVLFKRILSSLRLHQG